MTTPRARRPSNVAPYGARDGERVLARIIAIANKLGPRYDALAFRDRYGVTPDGFPRTSGASVGTTGTPDPTEAAVEARQHAIADPVRHAHLAADRALDAAVVDLLRAERIIRHALAADDTEPALAYCVNCRAVITFVGDDRPRRGRCLACYRYLQRHDRDRVTDGLRN